MIETMPELKNYKYVESHQFKNLYFGLLKEIDKYSKTTMIKTSKTLLQHIFNKEMEKLTPLIRTHNKQTRILNFMKKE